MRPRPHPQRHTVIGEFRIDDGVPADLLAALTSQERRVLERWLEVFQASRASRPGPVGLLIDRCRLAASVRALDVAAGTLSPAEAEAVRESVEAVSRMLRPAASARPARSCRSAAGAPGQGDLLEALSSGDANEPSEPGRSSRGGTWAMAGAELRSPHSNR